MILVNSLAPAYHRTRGGLDFAVADLGLAEFGRKEIRPAEHEMPGLLEGYQYSPSSAEEYNKDVYRLPKILDEKVAKIHVEVLGGELTKLTKDQAEYIGVDVEGPSKPEHYRY